MAIGPLGGVYIIFKHSYLDVEPFDFWDHIDG